MAGLLYQLPADDLAATTTPTLAVGTEDPDYPLTNLANGNPALPAKFLEDAVTIQYDHGSAIGLGIVVLGHTNLDGAAALERSAAVDFSDTVISLPFTLGAPDGDGYRPSSWLDASAAPARRYTRLTLTGNSVAIILGYLWLGGQTRELDRSYLFGFKRSSQRPGQAILETAFGVRSVTPPVGRRDRLEGSIILETAGRQALEAWRQGCGGTNRPMVIVPDPVTPATPHAWLARFDAAEESIGTTFGVDTIAVSWLELARGLGW